MHCASHKAGPEALDFAKLEIDKMLEMKEIEPDKTK